VQADNNTTVRNSPMATMYLFTFMFQILVAQGNAIHLNNKNVNSEFLSTKSGIFPMAQRSTLELR